MLGLEYAFSNNNNKCTLVFSVSGNYSNTVSQSLPSTTRVSYDVSASYQMLQQAVAKF